MWEEFFTIINFEMCFQSCKNETFAIILLNKVAPKSNLSIILLHILSEMQLLNNKIKVS